LVKGHRHRSILAQWSGRSRHGYDETVLQLLQIATELLQEAATPTSGGVKTYSDLAPEQGFEP
jgi:hypothetical protein